MLRRIVAGIACSLLLAGMSYAFDNYDEALKASVDAYGKDMAASAAAGEEAVKLATKPADKAQALYHLGHCYFRLQKVEQAVATWDAASKIAEAPASTRVAAQNMKAEGYAALGKPDESIKAYQELTQMPETPAETKALAFSHIALLLSGQQKYDEARAQLEKGMNIEGATPATKVELLIAEGITYRTQKNPDKERESYAKILSMDAPEANKALARLCLAESFAGEGKSNEARDNYAKIVESAGAPVGYKVRALTEMAKIDLDNMKVPEARADYQKIVDMADAPAESKAAAQKAIQEIDDAQK